MDIVRFTDGLTRCETWKLSDTGWDDWASTVDRFLAHAIRGITAEYTGSPVEWLEINFWQDSGRLIVFPSQEGPSGDRVERVCFELASEHLEVESRRVGNSIPEDEQDEAWEALNVAVWRRVGECLTAGDSSSELSAGRRSHRLRVAGYDYNPGEGSFRLTESGGPI
jgi:hypothetical protein